MRRRFIKDCKRILSATVCAVTAAVFAMAGAGEVSAADAAQLKVTEASGYAGDTVTVTLSLTDNPGIAGVAFKLGYDKDVLSVVSATEPENAVFTRATVNTEGDGFVGYSYADVANVTGSGDFLTVEFKIADGASLGDSEITLYGLDFSNEEYDSVEVSAESTKVTVLCNHVWGDVVTQTEPTCTEAGKGVKTCSVCGATEEVELPAKGHSFGEMEVVAEATCTENGKRVRTCSVCGATEEEVIPAKGHSFGEVEVVVEPTETETGKGVKTCTVCGATEEVVIPAKGQQVTEPSTDEKDPTTGNNDPTTGNDNPTTGNDKNQPTSGKNESANGKVQTGDNAGITAAVLFLICAVSGSAAVIAYKKRAVR